jgi:hypothetical protein
MLESPEFRIVRDRYRQVYGANLHSSFPRYAFDKGGAALGYRRASEGPFFVEQYLDAPVETVVALALSRPTRRSDIVELGNLASNNAMAMISLWDAVANDLAGSNEVAVATLTAPLRQMLRRIGLPFVVLAPAYPGNVRTEADDWGTYYSFAPQVCAGEIAAGQAAIGVFRGSRGQRRATRG